MSLITKNVLHVVPWEINPNSNCGADTDAAYLTSNNPMNNQLKLAGVSWDTLYTMYLINRVA
jgi:hypothetical protein